MDPHKWKLLINPCSYYTFLCDRTKEDCFISEVSVLIIFGVALVVVIYIAVSIVCVLYFRR